MPLGSPTNVSYHPSKAGQSLILIYIYIYIYIYICMSDSVNYDKVLHKYLILIVNLCLELFVCAFLLYFLHIVSPCSDIVPSSKLHLDSIYGQGTLMIPYIYILYTLYVYTAYMYILYVYCMYILCVYTLCLYI